MSRWTKAQEDAINARRGTILVSAAAGSGKTSVLVERLTKRLIDSENPCPADKVLVVTFTKAAANEMKERVDLSLRELAILEPHNKHLQSQLMLIPSMNISTVHSFCSKLCREYFYQLNISPDFKIASEEQQKDFMMQAVKEVVDDCIINENYNLPNVFSTDRSDYNLYGTIIELYKYANSHLDPEKWIDDKAEMYISNADIENKEWAKVVLSEIKTSLEHCVLLTQRNLDLIATDENYTKAYAKAFNEDLLCLGDLYDNFELYTWDEKLEKIANIKFSRVSPLSKTASIDMKNIVTSNRDFVKKLVKEIAEIFCETAEDCQNTIKEIYPFIRELCDATKKFSEIYKNLKSEKNFLDYGDLEHKTIELLLEKKDNLLVPNATARALSQNFNEIMIDEYQDTNEVQDWIFSALSKQETNKFMVGDLKQCIYSFRQAMPEIFISYKEQYKTYDSEKDEYPATIDLDKNFRSRDNVINTVNFIFSTLMSKEVGGVSYQDGETLKLGASYEDSDFCETELDFIPETSETNDSTEAKHIASKIKDIMNSDYMVNDRGVYRKAMYKDFCILQRSVNSHALTYSQILKEHGIPSKFSVAQGFFDCNEIKQIIAFLQVIDNPNQDIALLSVLFGPVYGFSADDVALLRIESRKISIYASLVADKTEKFSKFLQDLADLRMLSACTASDIFLDILYQRTNYKDLIMAQEDGETKIANLNLLRQYAGDYESSGYIGISGFLRFIDRMKKNQTDIESAKLVNDADNVVEIMTIHKSKGLEFPVCFVAGCSRRKPPQKAEVVLNSKLGIGIKLKSEITSAKYSNFMRDAIVMKNKKDEISEELRILYVAGTRAREKLIFVSVIKSLENSLKSILPMITNEKEASPYCVGKTNSFAKWLMLCALKHPDGQILRNEAFLDDSCVNTDDYTKWKINLKSAYKHHEIDTQQTQTESSVDSELLEKLKQKLNFVYADKELTSLPLKVTASAIAEKHSQKRKTLPRPSFISELGLNAAEKGTALHEYLQFCDFEKARENPEEELFRLVENGFVTKA
ncbi:MAG: helicase-exonuclease AddAB subunit AddA, partial [Clostridia bacterium]